MPDTRAPTVPQFTRRLGIETPEHLVLELELAGLGSRMAATVCDAGLLVLAFVLLGVGIQLLPTPTGGDAEGPWSTLAAIVLILTVFLLFWGYFLLFEALNDGRTPGKRLMGIRVLMDTGHPLTFTAAAVRNLVRIVDMQPVFTYQVGLAFVLFHAQNKRLGDIVAGTVAVRDAEAGGLGNIPRARRTRRAPGVEATRRGRDSGLCGAVSRGRVRSGAGPHLRRGPARARVPGARGERRAQRAVRPAYRTARTDRATRPARAAGRRGGSAGLCAGRVAAVRTPGRDWVPGHPRASGDRGRGSARRDDRPGARWRGAPGRRGRLRRGAFDVPPGGRFTHHHQQRAGGVLRVRFRDHGGDRDAPAAHAERALLRGGARAVRKLRAGGLATHLRGRPRGARADGDLHRWRGRTAGGPGAHRPGRPHATGCPRPRRPAGGAARRRGRAAPVPRGHDRGALVGERRRPGLQVRRQRRVGGAPGVLSRERVELPQEPGQRSCARGGHRSHRHDPTLRRRRDHHRAGGENRGRCGRLNGSSVQGFEDAAHLARERLDLLQARDRLRVILVGAQQEQLSLSEDRGQGVRQVVAQLPDGVQRVDHLEQRPVEIAEVMIPQVAHRLPQVRLRRGAEDLRGGALRLGVRRAEQDPPAPDSVLGPAYLEANGDELSVESNGGKVVDDRFGRIGCVVACRLSGHADPRAGLRKDKRRSRLRNTAEPAAPEVWEVQEVGGG